MNIIKTAVKRFWVTTFIFLLLPAVAPAQEEDSASASLVPWLEEYSGEDVRAEADTSSVEVRTFDSHTLDQLKADGDLHYRQAPTVAESLWDRFLRWLSQLISDLINGAVATDWGNVLLYGLGVVVITVVIMMLLRVNALQVFYAGQGASRFQHRVISENIHTIDFDQEIDRAAREQDYRRAVRLLFLYALKLLADKHHVHWQQGKTNHDYLAELKVADLRQGFHDLSYYFDYAWYGNFTLKPETFQHVHTIFNTWRVKIK
jgi:hypothetical protein